MSSSQGGNAPSWLFSFVDLAFLLLIAMTQVAADPGPDLGELPLPRIAEESATALPAQAPTRWQIRIYPPDRSDEPPFELVGPQAEAQRLDGPALRARLAALHGSGQKRPLLAPHQDARSQDLLDAVSWIEGAWPGRRRATVAPFAAPQ